MSRLSTTVKAYLALILLTLIWGYNWIVMKNVLAYASPFQFAALRTSLGAVVLMLLLVILRKPLRPRDTWRVAILGVLQTSGFTGLVMWALVQGGAGKTAVLTYTMPFWVMVLAWPLLGEKIRGTQWMAALAAIMGLLLILDPLHLGSDKISMLLAVLSGVCWALAVIFAKKLHARGPVDLLSLTAWQMLLGCVPIVAVALWLPAPPIQWTPYFIGGLAFNAVLGNALAWLLWLYALQRLPAGIASMTSLLAPVIGVLAAWAELGERPSPGEMVGMVLIGIALVIISLRSMQQRQPVEPAMGQD